jgi:hypothetical protein
MSINKRLLSALPLRTMSDLLFGPMYIYHNRVVFRGGAFAGSNPSEVSKST